jgi:hypothetical protein
MGITVAIFLGFGIFIALTGLAAFLISYMRDMTRCRSAEAHLQDVQDMQENGPSF